MHYFPKHLVFSTLAGLSALTSMIGAESLEDRVASLEKKLTDLSTENKLLREQQTKAGLPVVVAGKETKLAIGGFVQVHAETGDAPDSRYTGVTNRFLVRRARLNLKGAYGKDWSFKVESEFGASTVGSTSGYRAQLTDVYADWTKYPFASVRVGQFKTPFGWEQLMADTQNPFVERPLANDRLTVSRQIGASVFGAFLDNKIEYTVGAFNGNGVNNSNGDNSNFMTVARLAAKPWSGKIRRQPATWSAGVNAFTTRDTGTFTGTREGLGFDTQLSVGPAAFRAEWLRNSNDPVTGADVKSDGWYLTALYDLNKDWQLALRYETYDPNTLIANNEADTYVFGFNYRLKGNDVVLSLNYLAGNGDIGGGNDRLIARLQVVF